MELNTWFECKVSRDQVCDDGTTRAVKEVYLVDAMSFSEAEARIIEEMKPFTSGNLDPVTVKKCKFAEVVTSEEEEATTFYKVKLFFMILDESTDKEKDMPQNILVQAKNLQAAIKKTEELMRGSLVDYRFGSVAETSILDVFAYNKKTE
ncbi:MAG: DUF4494 domain-containing protein [Prevotellaceae bacterium]|nr:DUF4494 domain-containing protein [Prevotellaceae bacterium]